MGNLKGTTKSVLIITIFTLAGKLLGFIREVLIASKYGSGVDTDTYFVAITATFLATRFIINGISTTFVPILSEIESKEGKEGKVKHSNNIINILIVISFILGIGIWLITPLIIKILATGFRGDQYNLAIELTRIGLPMILFSGLLGIMTGYLHSEQKFISSAATGIPFNLVYIIFLLFLSNNFGIKGLMVTAVIAVGAQILIQIPEAKRNGYKYMFIFNLKDVYFKKIIMLSLPILLGVAISELNSIVDRTLASNLVYGSISALSYANKLNELVLGIFISSIVTVIFPMLSKQANNDNILELKRIMRIGINSILIITVPATVGILILSVPIVEVAFQRGAFDVRATIMTSQALFFYSLGLIGMSLNTLITRVYYSLQDTKTPMVNGAISVVTNIVLNLILVQFMAHNGLALATSIATNIAAIFLLYGLIKKIGSLGTKAYITTFLKTGLASGVMGVVAYLIYHGLYGALGVSKLYNLISLLVAVGVGVVVYLVICYVFKVEEVKSVVLSVKRRLVR